MLATLIGYSFFVCKRLSLLFSIYFLLPFVLYIHIVLLRHYSVHIIKLRSLKVCCYNSPQQIIGPEISLFFFFVIWWKRTLNQGCEERNTLEHIEYVCLRWRQVTRSKNTELPNLMEKTTTTENSGWRLSSISMK